MQTYPTDYSRCKTTRWLVYSVIQMPVISYLFLSQSTYVIDWWTQPMPCLLNVVLYCRLGLDLQICTVWQKCVTVIVGFDNWSATVACLTE